MMLDTPMKWDDSIDKEQTLEYAFSPSTCHESE